MCVQFHDFQTSTNLDITFLITLKKLTDHHSNLCPHQCRLTFMNKMNHNDIHDIQKRHLVIRF